MNIKSNNILISYKCVLDTDMAVINYMIKNYYKSKYINKDLIKATDYYKQYLLMTRKEINPLSVVIKEEYKDSINSLYKELQDNHWMDVLRFSSIMSFPQVLDMIYEQSGYHPVIDCENTQIGEFIHRHSKIKWDYKVQCKDIKNFFCIISHDYEELMKYKPLQGKSIYLPDVEYNYKDKKKEVPHIILQGLRMQNEIKFYTPYAEFIYPDN